MSQKFARQSIIVTIILFIGYIISFFKEAIIAKYFGVSSAVDAYTVAITIPVNLFAIIALAIHPIVIPIYSNLRINKSADCANNYICSLISIIIVISLFFIILFELFAGPVAYLFAPGVDLETHKLVVSLLRITLPTVLFTLVDRVLVGVMNVHKQFILPALSVYFLNLSIIICILMLHNRFGIAVACVGQVLGSILQMVLLVVLVRRFVKFRFQLKIKDDSIKDTGRRIIPVMWSTSIAEVNAIINRAVASFLFVGAISSLGYATKINTVLMTFFTSAISTIVYPLYAESSANNNIKQLNSRVNTTLSVYTFCLLPLMFGILCLKRELVTVAFARGAFDSEAVELTQSLLGFYSLGILFLAIRETITKVFYALHDTSTPARNTTIGLVLNIILNISLPFMLGAQGLALATSISAFVMSILLLFQLAHNYSEISLKSSIRGMLRMLIPTTIMSVSVLSFKFLTNLHSLSTLVIGFVLGGIVYVITSYICKVPVFSFLLKSIFYKSSVSKA